MLSYLHGFHAGNHADVLKHAVLVHLLEHLVLKPKPFSVIDTHAGAGIYDLGAERASLKAEHRAGVARLWGREDLPPMLARLLEIVRIFQDDATALSCYPGSPAIARALLRKDDPLHLFELHPAEAEALTSWAQNGDAPRAHVQRVDGFRGALGLLPPPSRRGLVFVDPPYELKTDFAAAVRFVTAAHKRFATGTVALWYPVVDRGRVDRLCADVVASGVPDVLRAELRIEPDREGHGMTGSGMIVVRPAWTLADALAQALPVLAEALATVPGSGEWTLETLVPEG